MIKYPHFANLRAMNVPFINVPKYVKQSANTQQDVKKDDGIFFRKKTLLN